MNDRPNLDIQPEPDLPASELASLSMGLLLGSGLILGALLGALFGHFQLNNAFGWGQDIAVGAVVGLVLGGLLSSLAVKLLSSRLAKRE